MTLFSKVNIQVTGQKRSNLDVARGRLVILAAMFVFFYILVAARVVDLSLISAHFDKQEHSDFDPKPQTPDEKMGRADILDRNGVILARSLKTFSLYADPLNVQEAPKVAKDLVAIFPDLSYGDILQRLQSERRFVWIKRNITPDDQHKVLYLGHPGLSFKEEEKRIYPQGNLTAHVVGYTNVDERGLGGLEASFDTLLSKNKDPLTTTIDVRVQHALRRELINTMKTFSAVAATGMVMDVNNGEIVAAVSLPDFDPHDVNLNDKEALFNRLTLGVFEPGSTFKIFTTAAVIEDTGAPMAQEFDARKPIKVGRFSISDFHPQKRVLTLPEVFMHSSNIGSVQMAQMVETKDFKNFLSDLGLFKTPEIELPEIGAPLIPTPWREISTMTVSYGHGLAISPLQLVTASASIMNGGILVKPTLIRYNAQKDGKQKSAVRVVSEKTSKSMRALMRLVVTDGTGNKAEVKGYNVGGKTGTAEKNDQGRYDTNRLRSSFIAFFPSEAPKYAIYIMIDEPKGTKETHGFATAGWVAAPAAKRVIESIATIEGIKPQESDELGGVLAGYVKTKEELEKEKNLAAIANN